MIGLNRATSRRTVLRAATAGAAIAATSALAGRAIANPTNAVGSTPAATQTATAIVIGSGFGGAVAALRLGEAGVTTTVLERGRRWPIRADGDTFTDLNNPDKRAAWFSTAPPINPLSIFTTLEPYPGLIDRVRGNGIDTVYGAGVGGGSLAFGAFTPTPRKVDFEMVFPHTADYDELIRDHYPTARAMLGAAPLPADILAHPQYRGARAWTRTLADYGVDPVPQDFAVDWDIVRAELSGRAKASLSVGGGPYGVNSGAKNSVDHNYLPAAEATGNVTIKPMHEVFEITPRERAKGFVVKARLIDDQHRTIEIVTMEADYLFMAAGSYYTTSLLVTARANGTLPNLSTHVGSGFGSNGDFLIIRTLLRDDVGHAQGGPGLSRMYEDRLPGGPVSMIYQATPFPPIAGGFTTTHMVQTHTPDRGTITFDRTTATTVLDYPFPGGTSTGDRRAMAFAGHFHERTETRFGHPANSIPVYPREADFGSSCTFHGLGGVVMGQAADADGKVHGYDNLYVTDGSFMPGAVGLVNPALTITAFAERTMDRFVATL